MATNPGVRPVLGHHAGWGMTTSSRYRVQPYKLTPGATDTMAVRVREKIDIHGVGTDVVEMQGVFTVRRDHPCSPDGRHEWGQCCVKTEFRSLELTGESPVFGTVRVHLAPDQSSHGEVLPADENSLAASCVAHCFPIIELPRLGMTLSTQGEPIELASKVVQIPPVGDVARSGNSATLVDESGSPVGELISSDIEVGEVLFSQPLGDTATEGEESPAHTHDQHDTPSGSHFYTEPPASEGAPSEGGGGMQGMPGMHGGPDRPPTPAGHPTGVTLPPEVVDRISRMEDEVRDLVKSVQALIGNK